jgi:hypothetical protein
VRYCSQSFIGNGLPILSIMICFSRKAPECIEKWVLTERTIFRDTREKSNSVSLPLPPFFTTLSLSLSPSIYIYPLMYRDGKFVREPLLTYVDVC